MTIQIKRFENTNGYVVHRIPGYWSGRVSAWFNGSGELIDAEQYIGGHWKYAEVTRPIREGSPMWRFIADRYRYIADTI